jgi:anti-anti-sigma factor
MRAEIRSRATKDAALAGTEITHRIVEGVAIVDVNANLSEPTNRKRFRSSIGFLLSHRQPHVIVNLSQLRYIGSLDIGVMLGGCKTLLDGHGSMGLVTNPRIKHVFEVMGIEIWGRYDSEEDALAYYRAHGALGPPPPE